LRNRACVATAISKCTAKLQADVREKRKADAPKDWRDSTSSLDRKYARGNMENMTDDGRLLAFLAMATAAAAGIAARRGGSRAAYGPPVVRHSFRGQTMRYLTASDLEETFGRTLTAEQRARLPELAAALEDLDGPYIGFGDQLSANGRRVRNGLKLADEVLGGYGVERIYRSSPDLGLYVNMGDTYTPTIVWESQYGAYIGSWGEVVERQMPPDENDTYTCEVCGYEGWGNEFTTRTVCTGCHEGGHGLG